jgi:hypothetical protein
MTFFPFSDEINLLKSAEKSQNAAQSISLCWTRVARWFVFKPKSKFGQILQGLAKEDDGIFYGQLVHFTVYCYLVQFV